MKYIKGVHRHGSEIFLSVLKDSKSLETMNITKSATTIKGISSIISEYNGIIWYNKYSKNKIRYNFEKKTKDYYRIKIEFNKGFFNIRPNTPYIDLKKYLDLTINHYIEIWSEYKNKEYAPIHGDLSLVGNVMFNNNEEAMFVDWEQFDNSSVMPTGIDPIMTIIENVWYETIIHKKITDDTLQHINKLIQNLNKANLLSPLLQEKPAQNAVKFIKANIEIWKGQHYKLPSLKMPNKFIEEIDYIVTNPH